MRIFYIATVFSFFCLVASGQNTRAVYGYYNINKDYAEWFYWKQMLMGDTTDNIPGLPKVGPKKAENILEGSINYCVDVCKAYHEFYGDEGYNYLLSNGRMIHIWRWVGDHFKVKREFYDNAIKG